MVNTFEEGRMKKTLIGFGIAFCIVIAASLFLVWRGGKEIREQIKIADARKQVWVNAAGHVAEEIGSPEADEAFELIKSAVACVYVNDKTYCKNNDNKSLGIVFLKTTKKLRSGKAIGIDFKENIILIPPGKYSETRKGVLLLKAAQSLLSGPRGQSLRNYPKQSECPAFSFFVDIF